MSDNRRNAVETEISVTDLDDLCVAVIDCPHSTPEWKERGIRVVRNFNLDDGRISFAKASYVDEATFAARTRRAAPEPGDIIVSREAPVGAVGLVPEGLTCCLGQRLVLLKVDKSKCSPEYLVTAMTSEFVTTQFQRANQTGSTVSNLTIPDLRRLRIPLVHGHDMVGEFAQRISGKIELNNQVNDNLQAMLQTLYGYWFLQFDFPDENGRPYRSSGGRMIWNDQLKREIPEGWRVVKLRELLRKNRKAFDYKIIEPTIDLSVMPTGSIALNSLSRSDAFSSNLYRMSEGDILFGAIRPYLKKAGIAPCDGVVAGTVHSFSPIRMDDYNFALATMTSEQMFSHAVRSSTGTRMPTVKADDLLNVTVAYSESVARAFNQIPVARPIIARVQESSRLGELRDWLLPMLMNGQATVASSDKLSFT